MTKRYTLFLVLIFALLVYVGLSFLTEDKQERTSDLARFLGPPEMSKVDPDKPLREQTRVFELGGRWFEIPIMYIDGRPKPGEHQESMLLEVVWPEMRSIWELETREEYDRVRTKERKIGWILLLPAERRPSLHKQIQNRKRHLTKIEVAGQYDGLQVFRYYHGPENDPELWSEMYIEMDGQGNVVSYNECRLGKGVRFPGCSHRFIDDGLIYKISYNRKRFLDEWREQKQRATKFINSMEINSQHNSRNGD